MNREKVQRMRAVFGQHGAAQNDDVLDLIDALLAEPAKFPCGHEGCGGTVMATSPTESTCDRCGDVYVGPEPPADVSSPGSLDARDGFGMSARPAGRTCAMAETTRNSIDEELTRARTKFPGNRHMLAALTEEVGELAQALIDNHRGKQTAEDVRNEAIQVATMAIRVLEEGDADFSYRARLEEEP